MKMLLCAAAAGALGVPVARAETVAIIPASDTTIYNDGAGETANGAGVGLFAGQNGINQTTRALLRFDIASVVPAGSAITAVTLRLVKNQGPASPHTMSLFKLTSDWGEGTSAPTSGGGGSGAPATAGSATWLHTFYSASFWTTPGGDFAAPSSAALSVGAAGAYLWSSAQMVADVQAWLDSDATNFGWIIRGTETGQSTASRFASREATNPADRPLLTIDYIPVPSPSTAVVFTLAAVPRRRRR